MIPSTRGVGNIRARPNRTTTSASTPQSSPPPTANLSFLRQSPSPPPPPGARRPQLVARAPVTPDRWTGRG